MTTLAPIDAIASAAALPMPLLDPVITATFPVRSNSFWVVIILAPNRIESVYNRDYSLVKKRASKARQTKEMAGDATTLLHIQNRPRRLEASREYHAIPDRFAGYRAEGIAMSEELLVDHKLKDGCVVLTREDRDGQSRLNFKVWMNTRHPADLVFEQLVLGLTDSQKSWLWPLEFQNTAEPLEGEPRVGTVIRMTYRVPRFDKPEIPARPVTYSYEFPQYNPEQRLFEYQSLDHPVKGGAIVQVVPLDENRSQVLWEGAYKHDADQTIVIESMVKYLPLLFDTIEDLTAAGPERLGE
jgi:hypothetical protein